jgi:AcrR family transcriptional regulator
MDSSKSKLSPRKRPVQDRAARTVEAIFDACIAQLLAQGIERLTTSRVAQTAGISVGTLYQYYPNKQVLLAATLEWHLDGLAEAMETACASVGGAPLETMVAAMVEAVLAPRLAAPGVARALLAVASEPEGVLLAARCSQRLQLAVGDALASAAGAQFGDTTMASFMLVAALSGQAQAMLAADMQASLAAPASEQMRAMALAYLGTLAPVPSGD